MREHDRLAAWRISAAEYPARGTTREQLAFLVRYAILAPSSHNAQPWLFRVCDDGVEVFCDRSRELPAVDPRGRQMLMGCGAAVFNLRLAMRRFGHADVVELMPGDDHPDLVARITLGAPLRPSADERLLFDAIPHRHTNRNAFEQRPVGHRIARALAAACEREGAWLSRLHPDDKGAMAGMLADTYRRRFRDRGYRREVSACLSTRPATRGDGIPTYSKPYAASGYRPPLLVRAFDIGAQVGEREAERVSGAPLVVVIGTDADDRAGWLRAGQAMQRTLLAGHRHGLSAAFVNQPVERDACRAQIADITGRGGFPQLALRLGYGPASPPTPRRSLREVMLRPVIGRRSPVLCSATARVAWGVAM